MPFKPLIQIEAQVRGCNKYSPKEIKVLLRTHPNDFSPEIEAIFFDLKDSGKTFRLVILEEIEDEPSPPLEVVKERDPMAVKRQSLALNIKTYASQFNKTEAEVVKEIYDKYGVASRKDLTYEQLSDANWRYRPLTDEELRQGR